MGRLEKITRDEAAAARESAADLARECIGEGAGMIPPGARIGSLSAWEWNKLVTGIVSGWIVERSRQLGADRVWREDHFLATGECPEPAEEGLCLTALPALGDLVEKLGLTDAPIGAWSRDQVVLFVWTAVRLVEDARVSRDERPGPLSAKEIEGVALG